MDTAVEFVLKKALDGETLTRGDLVRLLRPLEADRPLIRAAARQMRRRWTGDLIFTYGFVYLSTWCRNDCRFCAYRRTNENALRYRKSLAEVVAASKLLADSGVNLIDLTMGEDPATDDPGYIDEMALMIQRVKEATGLPVMISPGTVSEAALKKFRAAGADWYACYQETHNPELFARLRQGQSYEVRRQSKLAAAAAGLQVEEGALCGVGETDEDLADSILAMRELKAGQARAMGFVPPAEAESEGGGRWVSSPEPGAAQAREIDFIAALRLALPQALIPASLDVEGLAGLKIRLEAGANVITSLVPADLNLAGVAQASLDINNQARSVQGVRPVVEGCGLKLARPEQYKNWLAERAVRS